MSSKEIVAVAKNNVEVREYIVDKATDEKYYLPNTTKSYGEETVNAELGALQTQLDYWTNLDVKKYQEQQVAKLETAIEYLQLVQAEVVKSKGIKEE